MELLETKERFIELRAKGWSFDKIAKEIGKAKQTLIDWSKELQDEIANRKLKSAPYPGYPFLGVSGTRRGIDADGSLLGNNHPYIQAGITGLDKNIGRD